MNAVLDKDGTSCLYDKTMAETECKYEVLEKDASGSLCNAAKEEKIPINSDKDAAESLDDERSATSVNRNSESLPGQQANLTDEKPYGCGVCGTACKSHDGLIIHMQIHIGEKSFQCGICGYRSHRKGDIKNHQREHNGETLFKCEICGDTLSCKASLKQHMRRHTGERPYKCNICGKTYIGLCGMKFHKRKIHMSEKFERQKHFECDVCEKAFVNNRDLENHYRIHTGDKPFKCDFCERAFPVKVTLDAHKRKHTGEKPYSCNICGCLFTNRNTLYMHRKKHTGEKSYMCDVCGEAFTQNCRLMVHKRRHTGEKPHECFWCEFACADKSALNRHVQRKHTKTDNVKSNQVSVPEEVKPYKCDNCGHSFAEKRYLLDHKRIHTGEKPNKCAWCEFACSQKSSLRRHIKRKHSGQIINSTVNALSSDNITI